MHPHRQLHGNIRRPLGLLMTITLAICRSVSIPLAL
jgi:hypothetical protein